MGKASEYVPPYRLVLVIWDDAASNSETWVSPDAIADPERVMTIGWLVRETPTALAVASSVAGEDVTPEMVGNTMTIPRGMIVERRDLRLPAARKGK